MATRQRQRIRDRNDLWYIRTQRGESPKEIAEDSRHCLRTIRVGIREAKERANRAGDPSPVDADRAGDD